MKAIYVICFSVSLFLLNSCKDSSTSTEESSDVQTETSTTPNGESSENIGDPSKGHDYNFLTDKILIYNAVIGGPADENHPRKNDWIQLMNTGQYMAGRGSEQTHTGKWTYTHDNQVLFLQPDVQDYPMSEWSVMSTNEIIVLVGTQTYGNNATQIQLLKSTSRPQ